MTLTSRALDDGGPIPAEVRAAGREVSPPLSWTACLTAALRVFALVVHDLDAPTNSGDDVLHWMVWNIPATARSLPEGVPQGPQLSDGCAADQRERAVLSRTGGARDRAGASLRVRALSRSMR